MTLDTIYNEDCLKGMERIPDGSVDMVLTSPPYAMQRAKHYGGIAASDYPQWIVNVLRVIRPKLASHGSVLINIRSSVSDGCVMDYVLRSRLAIRDDGWTEPEELIWVKPDGAPLGHVQRPRRTWEHILWYSQSNKPYADLKATGNRTERIGLRNGRLGYDKSLYHDKPKPLISGVARVTDTFNISAGANAERFYKHPAQYPVALCEPLIGTFTSPGGIVLDPFAGSGTTAIACMNTGRRYIGFETDKGYYDASLKRIASHFCDKQAALCLEATRDESLTESERIGAQMGELDWMAEKLAINA